MVIKRYLIFWNVPNMIALQGASNEPYVIHNVDALLTVFFVKLSISGAAKKRTAIFAHQLTGLRVVRFVLHD
jgi:hypothetical protein